jgi:CheY-like chemotaxis protein
MTLTSLLPDLSPVPIRVLLVDRDADTRQMYSEFLKQSAYEIDEAEDGREALAKALTRRPDVIVTETRLPGISGFDLCRLLHEDALTRHILVIVVTGDAFDSEIARARLAGAELVLVKPCLPERLAAEMFRIVTRSRQTRQDAVTAPADARQRSTDQVRRTPLSRALRRGDTTAPPMPVPALLCPTCDQPLSYMKSHVGGVSSRHLEQWDYYECGSGCGTFQYRQRTRKLRQVN